MTAQTMLHHKAHKWLLSLLLILSAALPFMMTPKASAEGDVLTVAEAIANNTGTATVEGYIVGHIVSSTNLNTNAPFSNDYNVAIADSPTETNPANVLCVQVSAGFRGDFGLQTNPTIVGKKMQVKGSLATYNGLPGLKSPSTMTFVDGGELPPVPEAEKLNSIAEARAISDDQKLIEVTGIATTNQGYWGGKGFYIQDETAGLYVYTNTTGVNEGDEVTLTGKVSSYNGELQLQPTTFTVNSSDNALPETQVLSPDALNADTEGELVQVQNVTITNIAKVDNYGTTEFTATNEAGASVLVRIDNRTGFPYDEFVKSFMENDEMNITGISSNFNGEIQLKPRGAEDFTLLTKRPLKVDPYPGTVSVGTNVTLTSDWDNATIFYTLDGSTPTTERVVYDAPITINEDTTIQAIAVSGDETSDVYTYDYTAIKTEDIQIADIQGKGHFSPYQDVLVNDVEGVVTYVLDKNNFYMQDVTPDNNPKTSDAVLVYSKAHGLQAGDLISVDGKVTEWYVAGYSDMKQVDLPSTEITGATYEKLGTTAVPSPLVFGEDIFPPTEIIDNDRLTSFDPLEDGIDFWESIEGMLVAVDNAQIVGPQKYGELVVAQSNDGKTQFNDYGGINISANDYNPERFTVDINDESYVAKAGDHFEGRIAGPVGYEFGSYRVYTKTDLLPEMIEAPIVPKVTKLTKEEDKLNYASYNVENFSANPKFTSDEKVERIARSFVETMKSPDVVSLVEVQDNNGSTDDGTVDATESAQRLIDKIVEIGGPTYQYVDIPPVDKEDGGEPGGNIRVGFLYNPDRVTLVEGTKGSSTEGTAWEDGHLTLNPGRILDLPQPDTRKPLAAEFEFKGELFVAIAAHLNSKGGDQGLFGKNQPPYLGSEAERIELATMINEFIQKGLAQNPEMNFIVSGDMNDFEFTPALAALKGDELTNMVETVPVGERFSYYYQGNTQVLDHILVSNNLASYSVMDMVHVNALFMEEHGRASDHDPVMIQVDLKKPTPAPESPEKGKIIVKPENLDVRGDVVTLAAPEMGDDARIFVEFTKEAAAKLANADKPFVLTIDGGSLQMPLGNIDQLVAQGGFVIEIDYPKGAVKRPAHAKGATPVTHVKFLDSSYDELKMKFGENFVLTTTLPNGKEKVKKFR